MHSGYGSFDPHGLVSNTCPPIKVNKENGWVKMLRDYVVHQSLNS